MAKSKPPKIMKCNKGSRNQFGQAVPRLEAEESVGRDVFNCVDMVNIKNNKLEPKNELLHSDKSLFDLVIARSTNRKSATRKRAALFD